MYEDIRIRCVTEDDSFYYDDERLDIRDLTKLVCDICNDKPLDYGNFKLEPVFDLSDDFARYINGLDDVDIKAEKVGDATFVTAKSIKDFVPSEEPEYYQAHGLSPLEAFKEGLLSKEELGGFIKGNIIKYTVRAGKKDNA